MSDWKRTTQKLPLEGIRPEMKAAIREHIETYNLGSILDDYLICIETVSDKKKRDLFSLMGPKHTIQLAVITPRWLVLVVQDDKPGAPAVLSVQLKDASVEDFQNSPFYQKFQDNGVQITGAFTGRVGMHGSQRIGMFVGLGEEPAAREFKEILFEVVKNTRLR